MGLLGDFMQADADMAFMDTDGFAEPITYGSVTRGQLALNAIVNRQQPTNIDESQNSVAASIEIYVSLSQLPKVDTGGDYIMVAWRPGQTVGKYNIQEVINSDGGIWHLRARGAGVT